MDTASNSFKAVIGLEVHAQLLTQSKIFSGDATAYGAPPNTQISPITLALPGTLPKLNRKVIEFAVRMGIACQCEISKFTIFDRKNYFYPDLPKGYQLTQDRIPICKGGRVVIKTKDGSKSVTLNRIHLEEDAGKSIHLEHEEDTFVDYNRAGVPLIEIVTEPCMTSSEEAGALMNEIRKLIRYLGISDGNMEEGSLRCDANVSVMPAGATTLGKKVEVKNMNSIRNIQRAIDHEIERQTELLKAGRPVISETRTFDATTGLTHGMRTKEELNDYRYFPDPDLSPVVISDEWLEQIKSEMPALPDALFKKFVEVYGLPAYDAGVLTESREVALFFEGVCETTSNFKAASNWLMGPVKSYLNDMGVEMEAFPLAAKTIGELISLIDGGKISHTIAVQRLFPELLKDPGVGVWEKVQELNLDQDSDTDSIRPIVDEVIKEFPLKVEEFKKGKKGIMQMFMGEVMKRSRGKADPKVASQLLMEKLN